MSGLVKAFGATRALDSADLRIREGSVYGLLGPNGAGKTTTIRVLATLLRPDAGTATVLGHDVVREARTVRQKVSLTIRPEAAAAHQISAGEVGDGGDVGGAGHLLERPGVRVLPAGGGGEVRGEGARARRDVEQARLPGGHHSHASSFNGHSADSGVRMR